MRQRWYTQLMSRIDSAGYFTQPSIDIGYGDSFMCLHRRSNGISSGMAVWAAKEGRVIGELGHEVQYELPQSADVFQLLVDVLESNAITDSIIVKYDLVQIRLLSSETPQVDLDTRHYNFDTIQSSRNEFNLAYYAAGVLIYAASSLPTSLLADYKFEHDNLRFPPESLSPLKAASISRFVGILSEAQSHHLASRVLFSLRLEDLCTAILPDSIGLGTTTSFAYVYADTSMESSSVQLDDIFAIREAFPKKIATVKMQKLALLFLQFYLDPISSIAKRLLEDRLVTRDAVLNAYKEVELKIPQA